MVSFSSINGKKMHGHKYWITDVLKNELGFSGFTVSDWNGIEELPGSYKEQIKKSVNAGIDLFMVPEKWREFMSLLEELVLENQVSINRINDAVYRLLAVKYEMGLFNLRFEKEYSFGDTTNRLVANQLAKESIIIKNQSGLSGLKKQKNPYHRKAPLTTQAINVEVGLLNGRGVKTNVPGATSLYTSLKNLQGQS